MNNEFKYVYQFRGSVRSELCSVLDANDKWRELAACVGYSMRDVEQVVRIARNRSPSEVWLELWGQKAPTMHKLFIALSQIQHYQALLLLKDYVSEELHALIYEGEENLDKDSEPEDVPSSDSDDTMNQNNDAPKQFHSKLTNINRVNIMSEELQQEACASNARDAAYTGCAAGSSEMLQVISDAHRQLNISTPPPYFVPPNPQHQNMPTSGSLSTSNTSASSSGPARRVLGSSLASKKLILGVL